MKGILGRKVGMTSVFSDQGRAIPVTVIEVQPNIVSQVLTQDKHGYVATQLAAFDQRAKSAPMPEIGHLKKAGTTPKHFVREIRGMEGYTLGQVVKADIFKAGELVDVEGTSKGKGFAGTIKRYNQHIGPKSHGGGGGSQPIRQTGSLGDMVSNRVFKGMTMPGHLGHVKTTVQNLEVISVDTENNLILIKGSIPGPKRSFVIIEEAVKGLPAKDAVKLVDVKEAATKNHLLEEAKAAGADINTEMSVAEMKAAIAAALEAKAAAERAKEAEEEAAKAKAEADKLEAAAAKAHAEEEAAKAAGDLEAAAEAHAKAENIDKQAEAAEAHAKEAAQEAAKAEQAAEKAEKEAEKLQVEVEEEVKEEETKGGEA